MVLEHIKGSEELKSLLLRELKKLSQEIYEFLIEKISHTDGHLAFNLDVAELTIALHLTFNLPKDKATRDVRHQFYTHKTLIGRMAESDELRQYGGLNGLPKYKESPYGSFGTEHSSTSISAGLGTILGHDLKGLDYKVILVIGDGALTGGMTCEALNNAARTKRNFTIVLNDNNMSISEDVGGMSRYLNGLCTSSGYNDLKKNVTDALDRAPVVGSAMIDKIKRTKNSVGQLFTPGMPFENMSTTHLGPVDGHNIPALYKVLKETQKLDHAALVHVITEKGKGYRPAEKNPSHFHRVGLFDVDTDKPLSEQKSPPHTDVLSRKICQLGEQYSSLVAVTAAMPDGTGLTAFGREHPHRFLDVGIAEVHVVTSAAGMAAVGLKPVVAVYSSFLQRAYDQTLHDVRIQNPPVLFAISRAGLVGSDREARQGIFDYSFLTFIPNIDVMVPKNMWELGAVLELAMGYDRLLAVCYPRGEAYRGLKDFRQLVTHGGGEILYEEKDIALLAVGSMVNTKEHVKEKLKKEGYACSSASGRFIRSTDIELVNRLTGNHGLIIALGENVFQGGCGLAVTAHIHQNYPHIKVLNVALPDDYVEHGNVSILRGGLGIDSDSIIRTMRVRGWMSGLD